MWNNNDVEWSCADQINCCDLASIQLKSRWSLALRGFKLHRYGGIQLISEANNLTITSRTRHEHDPNDDAFHCAFGNHGFPPVPGLIFALPSAPGSVAGLNAIGVSP